MNKQSKRCYAVACVDTRRDDLVVPWATEGSPQDFSWDNVDSSKPIVYCAIGSHDYLCEYRERFYSAVLDAIAQRPYLQLILQVRDGALRQKLNNVPDNAYVTVWAPQLDILARASLFITHGGLSSVREAIYHAVPMVVVPFWNDGFGNAARVAYHHLGVVTSMKNINASVMASLIDKAMRDKAFASSIKRMRELCLAEGGCEAAADLVEKCLGRSGKTLTGIGTAEQDAPADADKPRR